MPGLSVPGLSVSSSSGSSVSTVPYSRDAVTGASEDLLVSRKNRKRSHLGAELAMLQAEERSREAEARIHLAGRKAYIESMLDAD